MSDEPPFVTPATLAATGCLLAAALAAIVLSDGPRAAPAEAATASRALVFVAREDGGLEVQDAGGQAIDSLVVEGDLFAITAARGLAGAAAETERFSLELRRTADGAFELRDVETGRSLPLRGFGQANHAALARYLAPES